MSACSYCGFPMSPDSPACGACGRRKPGRPSAGEGAREFRIKLGGANRKLFELVLEDLGTKLPSRGLAELLKRAEPQIRAGEFRT